MTIQVCIGSVCHLKGSYDVIGQLEDLIEKNGLTEKLDIKAAFCLGNCVGAVCVKFNGEMYSVQPSNVGEFFENVVKKQVI